MSVIYQMICTGIVCYLSLNMGLVFAWPSCTAKLFESNQTTLGRPMTGAEANLFGSLSSVGAMVATPLAGYYLDVVGRKKCAVVTAFTYVVSWSMLAASTRVEVVLLAMFLSGFGAAAMLVVRVFVSEICQESIRGAMTTGSLVFFTTGLLLSYVLGDVLEYHLMVYVALGVSLAGVALMCTLEESPTYLMRKGREEEAAKSVAFYRRVRPDSKEVSDEVDKLRRAFRRDIVTSDTPLTPEEQLLKPDGKVTVMDKMSKWRFIKKSKPTHRAMILTLTLVTASTFQGIIVLQVYAKPLFEEAVPSMSATLCSVLQAIVTLIAGVVAGYLTDIAGRRPLIIYSSLTTCLCCLLLGSQLHYHWAPHWVTVAVIYMFCMAYTCGAGSVPYVLVTDVFLPEVKSMMSMLVIEWSWLCCFILLYVYKPLELAIGLGPVFYVFGAISMFTALYAAGYMPETKGLPVDRIQEMFGQKLKGRRSVVLT